LGLFWQLPNANVERGAAGVIPIKKDAEIELMRASGRAARTVLEKVAALIRPGVTTRELDQAAADFMADLKCKSAFLGYRGFPGQVCISVNEEVVHGIGGSRRLQPGDIVSLDVGVNKAGWIGDTATTVAVGQISDGASKLLEVTQEALRIALLHAESGRRLGDLCSAIEQAVLAHGFSVVREFVGHGVGKKLHEEPQIPNFGVAGEGPRLKPGMTLAIEPMVNIGRPDVRVLSDGWTVVTRDNQLSAHFEHTVLITRGAPEILTCSGLT
jgi:methionyl aminopeptidase